MKIISINEATFQRLQKHAEPLVDNEDSVINRALDALENGKSLQSTAPRAVEHLFNAASDNPPDLRHAKLLSATLDEKDIQNPTWNLLMLQAVRCVSIVTDDIREIVGICSFNIVRGRCKNNGFTYYEDLDLSIQGSDANRISRGVINVCQKIGVRLDIQWVWREKSTAYAGERGRIFYNPDVK